MNGKAAKRIRKAQEIYGYAEPTAAAKQLKQLKKEYKLNPYHKRKTPKIEGHSFCLHKYKTPG